MTLAEQTTSWMNELIDQNVRNFESWHGDVSEELKPLLVEMVSQNMRFLGNHPYQMTQKMFEKYLQYRKVLNAHANRANPTPLAGDRVFIRTSRGTEYTHSLFTGRSETSRLCVCTQPYEPHLYNLPEVGKDFPMSVSGGYFQSIDDDMIDVERGPDRVHCRYWTWVSMAMANGGLYIPVEMLRWHLKDGTHDFY